MKIFISILIYSAFLLNLQAQTISLAPLDTAIFCAGQSFIVSYTITGSFNDGNYFTVQVSNDNFINFKKIGSIKSNIAGTIPAKIPADLSESNYYRLRVISNSPYKASDETLNISVFNPDYSSFKIQVNEQFFGSGEEVKFALNEKLQDYFERFSWNFGEDANQTLFVGYNTPPITYSNNGWKQITCELSPRLECIDSLTIDTDLYIYDCSVDIDSSAFVDSLVLDKISPENTSGQIWILPNGSLQISEAYKTLFLIEAGGNLNINSSSKCVFYIKSGGSLNVGVRVEKCLFIKAPGSSCNAYDSLGNILHNCDELNFTYKNAPEEGVKILRDLGYLGIADDSFDFYAAIYPNPSSEYITIPAGHLGISPGAIEICDMLGMLVLSRPIEQAAVMPEGGTGVKVDVSGLPPGLYFVRLGNITRKFVKI